MCVCFVAVGCLLCVYACVCVCVCVCVCMCDKTTIVTLFLLHPSQRNQEILDGSLSSF